MMLTVHGLPNKTKFHDVKALIKQECNIPDFILDNLVDDGFDSKKVRIGLTNENDGYKLMKCLEGFRMSGSHVLKIVPVGKPFQVQPQPTFEPRSNYSNQRNDYQNQSQQDYPSQHDYNRQSNLPSSHMPHGPSRSVGPDTKQGSLSESRGLLDARKSLSHAMSESRGVQDRYQGSIDRPERSQGPRSNTDFRGPLAPPTLRPTSMDSRAHGPQDSRSHAVHLDSGASFGMREQDGSLSYRGPIEHRQTANPEPMSGQQQWNSSGNVQWSGQTPTVQNQNTGYNYQQPMQQGNSGYGSQPNVAPQGGYSQNRAPVAQRYQQPKIAAPERIPIIKDIYQGQGQYNPAGQTTHSQGYQGQGSQPAWGQQGQQTKQLAYDKSYDERRLAIEKRADAKPQITQDYDKRHFSPTRSRPISPGRSPPRKIPNTATRPGQYLERRTSPTRHFTERRLSPNIRVSPNRQASPTRRIPSISTEFTSSGRRVSPSKISPTDRRLETRKSSPVRRISPRRNSPSAARRRISPFARKVSPGRRTSPPRKASPRRVSPSGGHVSPPARRVSPTGRRISPFSRKISPPARRVSPVRRDSPGRRNSPVRRASPGRRVSPGRRISPPGKRSSPGRRDEPRRMSPSMMNNYYVEDDRRMGGRLESPRRYSPKRSPPRASGRYSPSDNKYDTELAGAKDVKPIRPAYEPSQAQKYTGGAFRPNEMQYPTGARIEQKLSPWQNEKITYPIKKDNRDVPRAGRSDLVEKKQSSRSRSRSPVKDRYRRHSPSPRSPRRSWALEKRRSPDANREPPPPPLWPGQDSEEKPKHPVWERNSSDEERRFDVKYKPRFSPRREDEDRHGYRDEPKFERDYRPADRDDYRRESPQRDEKKLFNEVDKDFNDIYQRAVEFRRKGEELRKSSIRRNRSYELSDEESPVRETSPRVVRPEKTKPTWIPIKLQTKELERKTRWRLDPAVKEKRDKATDEIARRILEPHNFAGEQKLRVLEELKLSISNIMWEMFKDKDVSYIELVIKFRARYDVKDEEKILEDILSSMPSHYRNMLKRKGEGKTDVPSKVAKHEAAIPNQELKRPKLADAVKKKHLSHGHSSSRLTSRHDSRRHGVIEGRVTKTHGGLRHASRNRSMEKRAKDSHLLTPSYIYKEATPVPTSDRETNPQGLVDKPKGVVASRYNELSPLMTKMVEDELKNVMIKVWQTLPDDGALSDGETLIVDKLKGSTGDVLRNTIGLNVTKRLLNVHNAILVKVVIYSPVPASEIQAFAKKYQITDFKHVQRRTYAGRMASWTQLDDLYTTKNLKCGSSSVTVSPIYSFMKCPSNLRTIFDGTQDYSIAKKIEQESARKMKKAEGKVIVTADKVLAEQAKKEIAKKDKVSHIKEVKDNTEQCKTESMGKGKTEPTKNIAVAKHTVEKPVHKKSSDNKQCTPTDIVKNKIKTATKAANVNTTKGTNVDKKVVKPDSQANKVETIKTVAKKSPVTTNTPKQNVVASQIKVETTVETVAKKPPVTTDNPKQNVVAPQIKVEKTVKTVTQKPLATNSPKKNIVPPKTNASKVEAAKSGANESVATTEKIALPKPNVAKVAVTEAVANKPAVPTNSSSKNIVSPKPNNTKSEATKAIVNSPQASNTPIKEIGSAKPSDKKPVVAAKVELAKAPAKPVTLPVNSNSAKKEILTPKTSGAKKPEVKASKIEPTKTKVQPKTVSNKPVTNTPRKETAKPKPTEYKKPDTKFTKVSAKAPVKPKPNSKMNAKGKPENDFDELDDHDILALLSGGIVLDECSGSDED